MTCAGCNREAKYVLFEIKQPHCQKHFEEAIEGCIVPTPVMTVEAYEATKGATLDGQGKDYPRAS